MLPKENFAMSVTSVPGTELHSDLRLYRVSDAMGLLNLSRTVIYEQIRSGRLRSVRQGRSRLISAEAIRDYITLLEKEAQET
jgi:excisionase family DNA binding protein